MVYTANFGPKTGFNNLAMARGSSANVAVRIIFLQKKYSNMKPVDEPIHHLGKTLLSGQIFRSINTFRPIFGFNCRNF